MCTLDSVPSEGALDGRDRLLVAALRCHAEGAGCDLLEFFALVLPPDEARAAARALAEFARAHQGCARRPPRLGAPGDPATADELAAVQLVAALRADDHARAAALLAWLAAPAFRARLAAAAVRLATRLHHAALAAAAE